MDTRKRTKTMPSNNQRLIKRPITRPTRTVQLLAVAWILPLATALPALAAKDSCAVGSIPLAAPGDTVEVPIYVRDVSGTLLDGDAGTGRTIQDLAVLVKASPAAAVTSLTFQRAGVSADPTPVFEQHVGSGDERGAIVAFSESGDPISFNVDSPAPGDLVAQLLVGIAPGFDEGTISLELVEAKTALGNQAGSLAEKPAENRLDLVDGSIYVDSNGLFADGFESGNTTAWFRTVP